MGCAEVCERAGDCSTPPQGRVVVSRAMMEEPSQSATGDLPDGWTYGGTTEDGKHYYNSPNGVTWSPPMILPAGWVQVVDGSSGYC